MTNSVDHEPHDLITLGHVNLLGYQRTNLFNTGMVSLIPNEPGVYILHFYKLGTFYIGSSNTIRKRAVSHKSEILRGTHKNRNIQLCYNESRNEIDFYYRIYPSIEEALRVEHELISYFKQSTLICNLSPVASNSLVPMTEEQRELHSEAIKAQYINNPILLQKHIDRLKRLNADPKVRQGRSERKKAEWADPVKRAKNVEQASERMSKQWDDPELRAKRTKANQDRFTNDPTLKDRLSSARKNKWQDPEYRTIQIAKIRERNADPAYRAKLAESARNRKKRKTK